MAFSPNFDAFLKSLAGVMFSLESCSVVTLLCGPLVDRIVISFGSSMYKIPLTLIEASETQTENQP